MPRPGTMEVMRSSSVTLLAREVLRRWRAHVRRMKRARVAAALTFLRLLPQDWSGMVAFLVASFLL